MASYKVSDITFRQSRNHNNPTSTVGEYIANITQRLFNMVPGDDEYNLDMGLDIFGHVNRAFENGQRDTVYESKITEQFATYTDLNVSGVIALYSDGILYVSMAVSYAGRNYILETNSTGNDLISLIEKQM